MITTCHQCRNSTQKMIKNYQKEFQRVLMHGTYSILNNNLMILPQDRESWFILEH